MPTKENNNKKYLDDILENLSNISTSINALKDIFLYELYASKYQKLSKPEQDRVLQESIQRKQKVLSEYHWDLTKLGLVIFTLFGLVVNVIPQGAIDPYYTRLIFDNYLPMSIGTLAVLSVYSISLRIGRLRLIGLDWLSPSVAGVFIIGPILAIGIIITKSFSSSDTVFLSNLFLGIVLFSAVVFFDFKVSPWLLKRRLEKDAKRLREFKVKKMTLRQ